MSLRKELRQTLLDCAAVISAEHEISLMMLGRRCANNTAFFERLKNGEDMMVGTADEALAWFSHHWPKNREWPGGYRPSEKFTQTVMKGLPANRQLILIPRRSRAPASPKKRTSNRQPNTLPG